MRNLKKVLALVVAFSMMLSVVAFANYADVDKDADYAGAVELLSALEIFEGDDLGNFNPDNTITRAEVAAVVCRALGLESSAKGAAGATAFTDVAADHWASGYINLASQNGIINGYGDGTFGPEDKVTYEQVVKMLVCALGFEPMAATKGGYPTGYLVVASSQKITSGVSATVEAPRKTVAKLVYNALSTPKMDQTSYGTDEKYEVLDGKNDRDYATLLTDMDIYIATGVVGEKDGDDVDFDITEDSDDFEFEKGDNESFVINGSNILDYQHQNVDVYVRDSKNDYYVIAVVPSDIGETVTVISDDIKKYDSSKNEVEYYTDSSSNKTKTIKLDSSLSAYLNKGSAKTASQIMSIADADDDIELLFIENTGDSKYDVIIATKYVSGTVENVDADKDKLDIDGTVLNFDFDDDDVTIILTDVNGKELTLADFAEDDVVAVVADSTSPENFKNYDEYIKIINLGDSSVTGTVTETRTKDGKPHITIDGKEYEDATGEDLKNGDEGIFYIGMTGKVIKFDGSAASKNYAYVLEIAVSTSSFDDSREIKLLTEKDGVVTFDEASAAEDDVDALLETLTGSKDTQKYTWSTNKGKDIKDRLVTYKTNSKGELREIVPAVGDYDTITDEAYKAKSQKLGKTLEDDVVIFNVDKAEADDTLVKDIGYLVDDAEYTGYVFTNKSSGDTEVVVITKGGSKYSEETGFAIATGIYKTTDADNNDIYKVSYVQDGVEGTAVFDDDSKKSGSVDVADMDTGDVFVFSADTEGVVSDYAVIGVISNGLLDVDEDAIESVLEDMDDTAFAFGYINNTSRNNTSKYETLELVITDKYEGADETIKLDEGNRTDISVAKNDDTNKYTYNDANRRNVKIENGDFMAEDVYYREDNEVSYVFIRIYDGDVVDIYSFNERQKITNIITDETVKDSKAAAPVTDAIKALPAVGELTVADAAKVEAARASYDKLTAAQKKLVTNYETLTAAEAKIAELKAAATAAEAEAEAEVEEETETEAVEAAPEA